MVGKEMAGENDTEIFDLFEKLIESDLTMEESIHLDHLVSTDEENLKTYLEFASTHASLHYQDGTSCEIETGINLDEEARPSLSPLMMKPWLLGLSACLLIFLGFLAGKLGSSNADNPSVATIYSAQDCEWGTNDQPTTEGSLLKSGYLHLNSGTAIIKFTSGTKLNLEGPASLKLVDAMNCVLDEGKVVAAAPPLARGFTIETNHAVVTDRGAKFGVTHDRENDFTKVSVFNGPVDVKQKSTDSTKSLTSYQKIQVDKDEMRIRNPARLFPISRASALPGRIRITSDEGRGQDCYVSGSNHHSSESSPVLIVKNAASKSGKFVHNRKIYLSFDLNRVEGKTIKSAELQLCVLRSAYDAGTPPPEASFAVYGITDESLDDWDVSTLNWHNAPANDIHGVPDPEKSRFLGRFSISAGQYPGIGTVKTPELSDFLSSDTNGLVTLTILREATDPRWAGYSHSCAGSAHPEGVAPTLTIEVE